MPVSHVKISTRNRKGGVGAVPLLPFYDATRHKNFTGCKR